MTEAPVQCCVLFCESTGRNISSNGEGANLLCQLLVINIIRKTPYLLKYLKLLCDQRQLKTYKITYISLRSLKETIFSVDFRTT